MVTNLSPKPRSPLDSETHANCMLLRILVQSRRIKAPRVDRIEMKICWRQRTESGMTGQSQSVFWLLGLFLATCRPDLKQFHVEDQRRVRRDHATGSLSSIARRRRNSQLPLSSDLHSLYSFIPALNHLSSPQLKLEWLAT